MSLKESLVSHSQSLRLNVLRIFYSPLVTKTPEEREIIKRCLQCESISIDVQGSRERALWVGKLPQIVPDGQSIASDIAVSWLVCKSPLISTYSTCEFTLPRSPTESQSAAIVGSSHESPVRTLDSVRSCRLVRRV